MAAALASVSSLLGERETGQDVCTANVAAVSAVANVVKSSLGPLGLDKMMVNDVGDVTVTNDGATILKQLEVQHPAAKALVELSDLQDQEVGDGTTSVVLLAAELLQRANQLILSGIHSTNIIAGYKLAAKESCNYIRNHLSVMVDDSNASALVKAVARTTLSSKFIGEAEDHFSDIVMKAITAVKTVSPSGTVKYPEQAVNILKSHGRSSTESFLVDGYALARMSRAADGMPMVVRDARVALLDFNLRQHRMQLGVQVQIVEAEELERVRQREKDITKSKIEKILASGANVVLTTQGIDDMALKYFVEAGAIAVRRVERRDMKRLARALGAKLIVSMATLDGDEDFDSQWLGHCAEVAQERVGDWDFMFFRQCASQRSQSIILRGANEDLLEEAERSLHDALCTASRTLESSGVCAGGGATETALAIYLSDFGRTLGCREQASLLEFAEALLVLPKTLALNAGLDALELLGRLKREHYKSQHGSVSNLGYSPAGGKFCGLNLEAGSLRNNLDAGVLEPLVTKLKAIRFATEAAITILRIDDVIQIPPEPEDERGRN